MVSSLLTGGSDAALIDSAERKRELEGSIDNPELGLTHDDSSLSCKRHGATSVEEEIIIEEIMG